MSDAVAGSLCAHAAWQPLFLSILPAIQNCIDFAFRQTPAEEREEFTEEALANVATACANLVAQGRADRIYPAALAAFAVRQAREGRKVGGKLNSHDVLSKYCQRKRQVAVRCLNPSGSLESDWRESLIEHRKTPVPEIVAFRIDFPAWLATFPERQQQIALALAAGHTTNYVAQQFGISAGRVSQLRREFSRSWNDFHSEPESSVRGASLVPARVAEPTPTALAG
jgi:hypothetical protein